jgi:hypothetical protein
MNVPAHILARQKRDLVGAALGGINAGSPAHISIAGNRFTLVDDAGNQKPVQTLYLDVCVIDANPSVSKIFFDPRIPFEPGGDNSNPPICWSDNGVGASAQAAQPQNTSCQLCPQNAWGSAVSKATGKPVKACNDVKKLAVVVPGTELVFLLRIPPASLKNLAKYTQTLAGHGVDLPDAITRLEFESQGVLKFTPMGYVDEASAAFTDRVIAAKGTDQLVGRNDRPWMGQADAQKVAYAQQTALAPPVQTAPVAPAAAPMAPPPQPFGGAQAFNNQAASAVPFGAPPSPTPGPVANGPFGGAPAPAAASPFTQPTQQGSVETAPTKPRKPRAPKAEAAPSADDGIPPFLQRGAPESPEPATAPPVNQFGMNPSPAAPDAGIAAALDAAFRLPT